MDKTKLNKGLSLLEILVVITIFAVLGILVSQSVILTVRGTKKSETLVKVRENLNYAMAVTERQLRNSDSIPDCQSQAATRIDYVDQDGNNAFFSCNGLGTEDAYIASGSGAVTERLTNPEVIVTACSFTCTLSESNTPPAVTIDFSAKDAGSSGNQGQVTITDQINLRSY